MSKPESTTEKPVGIKVIDPACAPIIYFDGAPNFGFNNEVANLTLAASRHLPDGTGSIAVDVIAVAFLRCNRAGLLALRHAIDSALLLEAAPNQSQAN